MKDIIIFDNPIDGLSLFYKGELTVTIKVGPDFLKTTQYTGRIKDGEESKLGRQKIQLSPNFTQKYVYTRQTSTTSGFETETISCPCIDDTGKVIGEEEDKTVRDRVANTESVERKVTIREDGKIYKYFSTPDHEIIYVLDAVTGEILESYTYEKNENEASLTTNKKRYTIGKDRKFTINFNSDYNSRPVEYDLNYESYDLNGVNIDSPSSLSMAMSEFFPNYESWSVNTPPEIEQAVLQHEKEKEEKGRKPY